MLPDEQIRKINIASEMKSAYIDYSMSVIVSRALPDVRDGFKPVHRRVLYGMNEMGNTSNNPLKKCANCVGEVMGKYHPHGDSSIYYTLVRMAQPFSLRNTLVEGHGNFGSIDGDSPAAMRYTECRLEKLGEEMLRDIDSDTVDFQPNYDNSRREPVVLPTRFPNLLVNGSSGIAVGMATNMPTHNLRECIDACVALIDNPELTIPDLMKYVKAPDFPGGGIIYGYKGVVEAYTTGRGRIIIRANTEVEEHKTHTNIIVNELPYGVNKAELIKYIAAMVNDKRIDGIADLNDETSHKGMRIVIRLKAGVDPEVMINKLYQMTALQSAFSVNNVALVNGRPRTLNLKELLEAFVAHRHDVVIRRTRFELGKAQDRAHILEGLILASQNIDEVVEIIKTSPSSDVAQQRLIERFQFSAKQATAILDMQLRRLTALEQDKLQAAYQEVMELIKHLEEILQNRQVENELIKSELIEIRDKYGDDRRTKINYSGGEFTAESLISDDDMLITISHMGYIKRTALSEFRTQSRGGMGSRGSDTREEDFIEHVYQASMHDDLMVFTQMGQYYRLKVYELPAGTKTTKGRAIQNLLQIAPGDSIRAIIPVRGVKDTEFAQSHSVVFATRRGIVKRTSLVEYVNAPTKGKKAMEVAEDDRLVGVALTDGTRHIILASSAGKAIRFEETQLRQSGRTSGGVRGMSLPGADNEVVGMVAVRPDTNDDILALSAQGYGKRTSIDAYPLRSRGGQGVFTLNVTDKTGALVTIKHVDDRDDLVIINQSGITLRVPMTDLRTMGRMTQGVRIINLEKRGDTIASVCVVPHDEDDEAAAVAIEDTEGSQAVTESNPIPDISDTSDTSDISDISDTSDASDND